MKQGDKFLQELRDKADAHRRTREFKKILLQPKFKIDSLCLYLVLNEERN